MPIANLHRAELTVLGHLNESQRAMVAAKIATLKRGHVASQKSGAEISAPLSNSEAASLLNVNKSSVDSAKTVLKHGTLGEVAT